MTSAQSTSSRLITSRASGLIPADLTSSNGSPLKIISAVALRIMLNLQTKRTFNGMRSIDVIAILFG